MKLVRIPLILKQPLTRKPEKVKFCYSAQRQAPHVRFTEAKYSPRLPEIQFSSESKQI